MMKATSLTWLCVVLLCPFAYTQVPETELDPPFLMGDEEDERSLKVPLCQRAEWRYSYRKDQPGGLVLKEDTKEKYYFSKEAQFSAQEYETTAMLEAHPKDGFKRASTSITKLQGPCQFYQNRLTQITDWNFADPYNPAITLAYTQICVCTQWKVYKLPKWEHYQKLEKTNLRLRESFDQFLGEISSIREELYKEIKADVLKEVRK